MSADQACPNAVTVSPIACFAIRAAAEPGILSRLIELFAKRDLVPDAVQARRIGAERDLLAIDLQVDGLDPGLAERVAESMRQMVSVERVLLTELGAAAEAAS
jgi:acetolactate synthase small subunit